VTERQYDDRHPRRRWYALALLCVAAFMVILDASIVMVALPAIGADLGFGTGELQWVVSAYAITFGGLLLFGGRLSDLLGRRRLFLAGVALFLLASLVCGLAWSVESLVVARAVQGVSAAVMTPTALSIVLNSFAEGPERNKALGVWGATGGIGGTAGALVGGPITDGLGWSWIFWINVPAGLVLLGLGPVLLAESRAAVGRRTFDVAGAVTVTAALMLLVYGVGEAAEAGATGRRTVLPLGASLALLAAFVLIERRSAAPLVPLRIFRSRTLVGGNLVTVAIGMTVFGGMSFLLTQYAQRVLGYSAVEFGVMSSVLAITAIAGSFAGQHLVSRIGVRPVATGSLVLVGIGSLLMTGVSPDGGYLTDMLPGLLVFGPGLGAGTVAGSIAALSGVAAGDSGLASGLSNAAFQLGGGFGIAVLSTVAVAGNHRSGHTDPSAALTAGYQDAYDVAVLITIVGLALTWYLLRPARKRRTDLSQAQPLPGLTPTPMPFIGRKR
jgi:EmrB/QacA subfamily drug resistance transporter